MNDDEHVKRWNVWFCFRCMLNNYASLHVFTSKHFTSVCMHMFMGLVVRIDNGMVASSTPVGGSGMLQYGIRAHVAAWASMGREGSLTEAGFPLHNRRNQKIRKISMKFF